uniref:Uncharacterized protein n=1 Tax=Arundo donax TaxID=35708 RepID=A0A0A8Y3Y1_ARUDO
MASLAARATPPSSMHQLGDAGILQCNGLLVHGGVLPGKHITHLHPRCLGVRHIIQHCHFQAVRRQQPTSTLVHAVSLSRISWEHRHHILLKNWDMHAADIQH